MSIDDVLYELKFGNPTEEALNAAVEYLRNYKDTLQVLRIIEKNTNYLKKYLKDIEEK